MAITFIKPEDLKVFENESELILRKGFLHINEVIINKQESSKSFLENFSRLIASKQITLSESDEACSDFLQLLKLDLIGTKIESNVLVITPLALPSWFSEKYRVLALSQLLSRKEEIEVREDKSPYSLQRLHGRVREKLKKYGKIYVIDEFKNFTSLRSINKLLFDLNKEFAVGFIDNENVYLTGIKPKYTGCYMCLEQHILSKFQGRTEDYYAGYEDSKDCEGLPFLLALIDQDIKNVSKFSMSELTGNVIHMYTPNFEYSFGLNMRSSSCPTCCKINNLRFKEQNIKSVDILKAYGELSD